MSETQKDDVQLLCLQTVKQTLEADSVELDDQLVSLGADSLRIATIINAISIRLDIDDIDISSLYELRTVGDIVEYMAERRAKASLDDRPPCTEAPPTPSVPISTPASPQEQRMFAMWSRNPKNTAYNVRTGLVVIGDFDVSVAERVINAMLYKYPILRSVFDTDSTGVLMRTVRPHSPISLQVDEKTRVVDQPEPFDLREGPLFRARLSKAAHDRTYIEIEMHHVITDGTSLTVFAEEFANNYNVLLEGGEVSRSNSWDYAHYELELAEGTDEQREDGLSTYWRQVLLDCPHPCPKADDFVPGATGISRYASLHKNVLHRAVRSCETRDGDKVTHAGIMLSAYCIVLARCFGCDDMVVGVPFANRTKRKFSRTIGLFVNTLPIRVDLRSEVYARTVVEGVVQQLRHAYHHQGDQLEKIADTVARTSGANDELFNVMFTMENMPLGFIGLGESKVQLMPTTQAGLKVPMNLLITETEDEYRLELYFDRKLLEAADGELVLAFMQSVVEGIAASPNVPIDEFVPVVEER